MKKIIGLIAVIWLCGMFMLFRNDYTYNRQKEASDAIYLYSLDCIEKDIPYQMGNYTRMKIRYDEYMWDFTLWGKGSAIKPKYQELLKPYLD